MPILLTELTQQCDILNELFGNSGEVCNGNVCESEMSVDENRGRGLVS